MTFSPALVSTEPASTSDADVLLLAAVNVDGAAFMRAPAEFAELDEQLAALGFTGAAEQLVRIPASVGQAKSIAIVGLGKTVNTESLRGATAAAVRRLTGVESVAIAIPVADAAEAAAVLEGAGIGSYSFTEYRTTTLERTKTPATQLTVHLEQHAPADADAVDEDDADDLPAALDLDVEALIARADVLSEAFALVKDLVNTPPSDLFPASMAERAQAAAAGLPVELEIWDEAELANDGFGGILGVGQGSSRPPRLVKVSYSPSRSPARPIPSTWPWSARASPSTPAGSR
nr:M17 family peptidase N-terminal domain-containing protein [Microterricola viridarii]